MLEYNTTSLPNDKAETVGFQYVSYLSIQILTEKRVLSMLFFEFQGTKVRNYLNSTK